MQLKLLRVFAVALSILLPLQGIAEVTAGICMALTHHESGSAPDTSGAHGDHSQHKSASNHGDHGHGDADHESKAGHCGPCTACCASASITGPVAALSPAPPQAAIDPLPEFFPPGHAPVQLDRPPLAL